jgi:hypothetical protein
MDEKTFPGFFISLFTKIFGQNANLAMSIFMFFQSAPGKKLAADIKIAFATAEGKGLLAEIGKMLDVAPDA